MKKIFPAIIFLSLIICGLLVTSSILAQEKPEQYIITFTSLTSRTGKQQLIGQYRGIWKKELPFINGAVVKLNPSMVKLLQKNFFIKSVEPDVKAYILENTLPVQTSASAICNWWPSFPGCNPSPTPTPRPSPIPTSSPTPSPTPTPSPLSSPSPINSPTPTPSSSVLPTNSPVTSPSISPSPAVSPIASASPASDQAVPWGITKISASSAWSFSRGENIKVAVVDTGIDTNHPDLINNIAGCVNLISTNLTCEDDNGHGTHVSGTIAAEDNNLGVVGVAPSSKIYAVKVLDSDGGGYISDIIEGIQWAVDNQMQIINLSLGTSSDITAFHNAVINAKNAGVLVVAAAGNSGSRNNTVKYPAKYAEVIAVAAIDKNDSVPYWSSRGIEVDIAAPGKDVYSTDYEDGYYTMSGTSMAVPHVVGVAALRLNLHIDENVDTLINILKTQTDALPYSTNLVGAGRINAYKAVTAP